MRSYHLVTLLAVAACGPETTSFRTTERGDGGEHPAAVYLERDVANVRVSTSGGYIGSSDEPMTHVGFEIRNTSASTIFFDGEALALQLLDKYGAPLPAARFVTVTPLGPAQVPIAGGATTTLDAYFLLPVRPRVVDAMHVHWALRIDDAPAAETTPFVRDDDFPVSEPPRRSLETQSVDRI